MHIDAHKRNTPPNKHMVTMIAFITYKSSLVPLFEGLWSSNSWEFELSGFRRNRTDDLGIDSPSLWPTEPRLHVRTGMQFFVTIESNNINVEMVL